MAEKLPISRLFALYDVWAEYPPERVSLAVMAGTVGKSKSEAPGDFSGVVGILPVETVTNEEFDSILKGWGYDGE